MGGDISMSKTLTPHEATAPLRGRVVRSRVRIWLVHTSPLPERIAGTNSLIILSLPIMIASGKHEVRLWP